MDAVNPALVHVNNLLKSRIPGVGKHGLQQSDVAGFSLSGLDLGHYPTIHLFVASVSYSEAEML